MHWRKDSVVTVFPFQPRWRKRPHGAAFFEKSRCSQADEEESQPQPESSPPEDEPHSQAELSEDDTHAVNAQEVRTSPLVRIYLFQLSLLKAQLTSHSDQFDSDIDHNVL